MHRTLTSVFFALIAIALDVSDFSAASLFKAPQPQPSVLLIHGRGQVPGARSAVEREWQTSIDPGLRLAAAPSLIPAGARHFFWYADILAGSEGGCRFAT